MNKIALSRSVPNSRKGSVIIPLFYPGSYTSRAASLNSAIHHGIRRSKGVGFRGTERSRAPNAGRSYGEREGVQQGFEKPPRSSARRQALTRGPEDRTATFSPRSRNGREKPRASASTYERRGFANDGESLVGNARGGEWDARSLGKPTARSLRESDRPSFSRGNNKAAPAARRSQDTGSYEGPSSGRVLYPSLSSRQSANNFLSRASNSKQRYLQTKDFGSQERRSQSEDSGRPTVRYGTQGRSFGSEDERMPEPYRSRENGVNSDNSERPSLLESTNKTRDDSSSKQSRMDRQMPISIPYTTPASEFLYGTSVVEAALRTRRVPRRKHYKLYIYNGENRDGVNMERDAGLERLAVKSGVEVLRVSGDWLRVMDKMSGGRPHNGYILEASPLPRMPVSSLGELTTIDGQSGFKVILDHQSREEAVVNGTDDFIRYFNNVPGRKPLVLLLDSIVDPGNLGGIIRTASFLGVTAIVVSTRNSASFTPVVLKASAGASENVTLFSVNKPAGFLVDSQAAGWKVYAAVAPTSRPDADVKMSTTTDDLEDPLSEDPCILMLGGEGEGLRLNLRSKADVNLSIVGSGRSHKVDSLNVSVAAGILCSSFLRKSNMKMNASPNKDPKVEDRVEPEGDLF